MTDFPYLNQLEVDPMVLRAATLVEASVSQPTGGLQLSPGGPTLKAVWENLRIEVHDLLCTDSEKYRTERSLIRTTGAPAIATLTAFLTGNFGLPVASASALAGLSLLLPLKMVAISWCKCFQSSPHQMGDEEVKGLKQLVARSGNDSGNVATPGGAQ